MSLSYGLRPIFESLAYRDALSLSDTSQVQNYRLARWTAKTGKAHQRYFLSPICWLHFQLVQLLLAALEVHWLFQGLLLVVLVLIFLLLLLVVAHLWYHLG